MNSDDIIELLQKRFLESGEILFNEAANYIHKLEMRHLGDSVAEVIDAYCRPLQENVMSDDIVNRLNSVCHCGFVCATYGSDRVPCDSCRAATYIQHLRQAGDALAQGVRTGRWDDALDAWTQLRNAQK